MKKLRNRRQRDRRKIGWKNGYRRLDGSWTAGGWMDGWMDGALNIPSRTALMSFSSGVVLAGFTIAMRVGGASPLKGGTPG